MNFRMIKGFPIRLALVNLGPPLLVAVAFLGPALGPGALMNLDFIVLPHLDVPAAFFGIGPDLPRRVPLWAIIGGISSVVPATTTVKVLLVATFLISWSGMARWATQLGLRHHVLAAALYSTSPLLLTRMGIGHLGLVLAAAILPWIAPVLFDPLKNRAHLFLASGAMGLCGYNGGVLALLTVAVSVWFSSSKALRHAVMAIAVAVAAQTPWLAPTIGVALSVSVAPTSAVPFGVEVGDNPLGVLSLSAGNGYWNSYFQVGATGSTSVVVGAILLGLALLGFPRIPTKIRRPLATLGVSTWLVAALSTWSVTDGLFRALTTNPVGGLLRDPQRLIILHLLWLAPSACLGAESLRDHLSGRLARAAAALPVAAVLAVSIPGLWGLNHNLEAEPVPESWTKARALVVAAPGPTLALPWAQYLNQQLPGGELRRVLNPMPYLFGGDVLTSSDTLLEANVVEAGDPRELIIAEAIKALVDDETPISTQLRGLGIRWVALQTTSELAEQYAALGSDPGLTVVLDSPEITLYAVVEWLGLVRTADGRPVPTDQLGSFAYMLQGDFSGGATLSRAGGRGWLQGWSSTFVTQDGQLAVPRVRGIVWHPGTALALVGYVSFTVVTVCCFRQRKGST